MVPTATAAAPVFGDKLYQQRAREALPILVRQARAGKQITYGQLATELSMPNARNLNYVLGCIGQTMLYLSRKWGQKVPTIQCLVVNQNTRLPGAGIGWFLTSKDEFETMTMADKRRLVKVNAEEVFAYRGWGDVLRSLDLAEADTTPTELLQRIAATSWGGRGESDQHRRLKRHVATHPELLNLPRHLCGLEEYRLPSGDAVDVLFDSQGTMTAVEVKSAISDVEDMTRGLFQCVKYHAVIEAYQTANGRPRDVRVILLLGATLPRILLPLRNMLGIEVIENVAPGT